MSASPPPSKGRKVTVRGVGIAVAFIAAVQLVSIWLTLLNKPTFQASGYSYAPLGTTTAGSAGSTVLLVMVVFASTLLLVWLVRKKMNFSFKIIIFAATSLAAFSLTLLTVDDIFLSILRTSSVMVELALAFLPVLAIGYTTFRRQSPIISTLVLALLSAEVGSYFAATLPLLTALLLPIAFSLYDIYAVFRGPLGELVSLAPSNVLSGVSVKVGEFTIGLGDTTFYSMLPALAVYQVDVGSSLATLAAVDLGVVLTLYLLTKRKLLPGLPIPMALGVLVLLLLVSYL